MTVPSPFGLYPSRACLPAQRLAVGHALVLDAPVLAGGATLFRASLWLPVPATVRASARLLLAASALRVRFAPTTLQVPTDDHAWFSRVDTESDDRTAQLHFVWPGSVSRLADPLGYHDEAFKLFRVDGDRVAAEATMSGTTGAALNPPWVGSPMQVVMERALPQIGLQALDKSQAAFKDAPPPFGARAAPGGGAPGSVSALGDGGRASKLIRTRSHLVPTVSVAGVPSSPRLKLTLEARGAPPETLLWQALLPGEQGAVNLPAGALADEWAAAFEQVRKRLADEAPPLPNQALLRLDIESDAPCAVTLTQLALALDEERELLGSETQLDFDGTREQTQALALSLPPAAPQSLVLAGRVGGGTDAPAAAAALPAALRRGVLLQASACARVQASFSGPQRVAGVAIAWHPLSTALTLTLRLLPVSGAGPVLEHKLVLDTPAPGWLALRAPALDLQAGALWIELCVAEGSGLWLAVDEAAAIAPGWTHTLGDGPSRQQPLGLTPGYAWLGQASAPEQPRQVAVLSGSQVLAPLLADRFELDCPASALAGLASLGLQLRSASATRVTLQSARARLRLP